ncbi:MAG: hypothetical protein F4X20_00695 [Dehalococcoidia bacterium]|nr:hypothetical protein [Dehalococcoidia bacterium]
MRIACVLITHPRAKIEMRRRPDLADRPAVIVTRGQKKPVVVDHLPAASRIITGMTPEQALSQQAAALILEADEPTYRSVFRQTLTGLQQVSDQVEDAELGTAYVRVAGVDEMYGGEDVLVTALHRAVPSYLQARIGVGEGKFPAFAAAVASPPLGVTTVPSDAAKFLSPRPVDLLPIKEEARFGLHRFGLRTLGDVAAMSEAALVDQFGTEGSAVWHLSHGNDDSPLIPLAYEESVSERMSLPFASRSLELVTVTVDTLLKRTYATPRMRGRYAGAVTVHCLLLNASAWERTLRFKQPAGSWERASELIAPQMEQDHPLAPVEEISVTLSDLSGDAGMQMGLLRDHRRDRHERLLEIGRGLPDHLKGGNGLYQVLDVAPWHPAPEMRALRVPIDSSTGDDATPLATPTVLSVREGPNRQPMAVQLGKKWHRIANIEDRWSFDLWWLPHPLTRTYYRVSREDGRELILFRDRRDDCWYQHVP